MKVSETWLAHGCCSSRSGSSLSGASCRQIPTGKSPPPFSLSPNARTEISEAPHTTHITNLMPLPRLPPVTPYMQ